MDSKLNPGLKAKKQQKVTKEHVFLIFLYNYLNIILRIYLELKNIPLQGCQEIEYIIQ